MYGIDTNILVYMFDAASIYQNEAKIFIAESLKKEKIAIAEFTLFEFYSVITDGRKVKTPLGPFEANAIIQDFYESADFEVFSLLEEKLYNIFSYAKENNIKRNDVYDLKIAYTLKSNEIKTIYTANTKDFKRFDFLEAINPFKQNAILHAPCPKRYIPYSRQSIDEKDVASVCSVLRSDWLTQGPKIKEFEDAIAAYCGAKFVVAVSSGTAALHIACLAAGLGKDDTLWTSPNTFVASANCALYCRAKPGFVDINSLTYNMDVDSLEAKLSGAAKTDSLPEIVIPVHFAGQSCEMERIYNLSKKYNFKIIEDACHALGGSYKGNKIGSCRFSELTVFSFHPVKHITTGEGGSITTNNQDLYEKLLLLRTHGITKTPEKFIKKDLAFGNPDFTNSQSLAQTAGRIAPGQAEINNLQSVSPWYYQQIDLGMNYRITDIQSALGLSQLDQLDQFILKRRELAQRYNTLLEGLPLTLPFQHEDTYSAFHLYVIKVNERDCNMTREGVFKGLRDKNIGVNVHYIPVHTQPFYQQMGFHFGQFPRAEEYYQSAITLPLFPSMTHDDQDFIVNSLKEIISG